MLYPLCIEAILILEGLVYIATLTIIIEKALEWTTRKKIHMLCCQLDYLCSVEYYYNEDME